MPFKSTIGLAVLALGAQLASGNLHLARHGLLQIHPSFTGDGITLYPAHHPDHDADHHMHLAPQAEHLLYYSQEGHRPAMHGSKHGSLKAKFTRPTVVLDHTSHLKDVDCTESNQMKVCFSNKDAFEVAAKTWNTTDLTIVTFHVGCGDELEGKRSYFHAQRPISINERTRCIVLATKEVDHDDALESGEIKWGTYEDSNYRKRTPALGHVRMANPDDPDVEQPTGDTGDGGDVAQPAEPTPTDESSPEPTSDDDALPSELPPDTTNDMDGYTDDTDLDAAEMKEFIAQLKAGFDGGPTVNMVENTTALDEFFLGLDFDDSDTTNQAPPDDDLPVIYEDGTVPTEDHPEDYPDGGDPVFDGTGDDSGDTTANEDESMRRRKAAFRQSSTPRSVQKQTRQYTSQALSSRRDVSIHLEARFLEAIYQGIMSLIRKIRSFFDVFVKVVEVVASIIKEVAIISAKLVAAAFGVPFHHSYHNDFDFDYQPSFNTGNKPPAIFGEENGVEIASSGGFYKIQCAKCGIHAKFSVDGVLAFSIKDGVTRGRVSLENKDPFRIDAQFGIELEVQGEASAESKKKKHSIKLPKKQLGSLPLSPLAIPGIIILGPEVTLNAELEMTLSGQASLLIGGSLIIAKGRAVLDAINKTGNGITGLEAKFKPVAKLNGTITASAQLGLPVAIEVGLDILNGKWKKSVGLVNKPGVYASASYTNNADRVCDGVEIRVGVRNQIYVSVLDIYEYPIRTDTIYEQGLGCITSGGFDPNKVQETKVFNQVIKGSGGSDTIADTKPPFKNVSMSLTQKEKKTGYRLIVDEAQTSILVAGKDGGIYMVESKEGYDSSAPFGTLNLTSNVFNIDVFGRLMTSISYFAHTGCATVDLVDAKQRKTDQIAASISLIKDPATGTENYAIVVGDQEKKEGKGHLLIRYPTFCKTAKGSRLFATRWIMNAKGVWYDNRREEATNPYQKDSNRLVMKRYGVENVYKDCRTVRLTSKPQS